MVCKAAPPLCWRVPCRWQSSHSSIFFGRKTAFRKAGSHPPRVLCRDGPCAHAHLPALTRCAATVGSRRPRGRAEGPPCGVAMVAGAVLAGVGGQPGPQVSGRGTSPPTAIPHWAVRCSLPRQSGLEALLRLRLPVRGRAEPGGLAGEARGQGTRALGLPCGGNQSRKAGPGSTAPHPEASAYWFAAHWTRP